MGLRGGLAMAWARLAHKSLTQKPHLHALARILIRTGQNKRHGCVHCSAVGATLRLLAR
jgi:hypothetical protein